MDGRTDGRTDRQTDGLLNDERFDNQPHKIFIFSHVKAVHFSQILDQSTSINTQFNVKDL